MELYNTVDAMCNLLSIIGAILVANDWYGLELKPSILAGKILFVNDNKTSRHACFTIFRFLLLKVN